MKYVRSYLCTIVLASGLAFGCGSESSKPANTQHPQNSAGNLNQPANLADGTAPADGSPPVNASPNGNQPVNAQPMAGFPSANKDLTQAGNMKPYSVAAPDDSEVTTELLDNVVETRTFKKHPQLLKVERTTYVSENKKVIKVFLKGGSVKEVADSKLPEPMKAPAADIMKAIGQ